MALVDRTRLKRMSSKETSMTHELRVEEFRHDSQRYIASVTSPDWQCQTTNESICWEFCDYLFLDFPRLETIEAAGCEMRITEDEIRHLLKTVGTDKTPEIDGLPYGVF